MLTEMANTGKIPSFLKTSIGCYLSKDKSEKAKLYDIRLMQVSPHFSFIKFLEFMIGTSSSSVIQQ
jgi:hypothetical protein